MQWRRYLPFAALIAAQLIVVLLAPSRPSVQAATTLGGSSPSFGGNSSGGGSGVPGAVGTKGTSGKAGSGFNSAGLGGAGGGSSSSGGAGPNTATGAGGGSKAAGAAAVAPPQRGGGGNKQEFCVVGLIEHPPCVKRFKGGSNGGATSMGVTAKTITVIMYRNQDNSAVDAILRATGTYMSPQAEQQQLAVIQKFVNSHYQLYGRQVRFVFYHGNCSIAPPNDSCFRNEANSIVQKYHPYALFWDNSASEGAFFDQLSRDGVVNWGGWGYSDRGFDDPLRPYHYDLFTGGDVQAELAGQMWCNELAGRKAVYAGGLLRNQVRKVAVVYPQNPQTIPAAHLLESIINHCDKNGAFDAPYSSDTTTAASQATADTTKERNAGVTSILWFSDPIAPAYGTHAQSTQNYFPEEILSGGQLLDYDALAQTYNSSEWKHAFGLSDLAQSVPVSQVDAGKIWHEEGMSGQPNPNSNLETSYALTLAGGLEAAGPDLTPLNFEAGTLTMPGYDSWSKYHNPQLVYIKFGRGDYTGISDARMVYWDPNKRSPINGKNGTYVPLRGGERYQPGQLPKGQPRLPSSV